MNDVVEKPLQEMCDPVAGKEVEIKCLGALLKEAKGKIWEVSVWAADIRPEEALDEAWAELLDEWDQMLEKFRGVAVRGKYVDPIPDRATVKEAARLLWCFSLGDELAAEQRDTIEEARMIAWRKHKEYRDWWDQSAFFPGNARDWIDRWKDGESPEIAKAAFSRIGDWMSVTEKR